MILRLTLLFFLFISCNNEKKTFFGGKILNKTSDFISIYRNNVMIAESNIDSVGVFNMSLDTIKSGLYSFYHEPEFQYIIIDNNDNLQIRLNTLDFDESLVYTGIGSSKNNFLMDVFLRSENDEIYINSKLDLDYKNFKNLVDSLYQKQAFYFNDFITYNKLSNTSKTIIKTATLYPYISKFHSYVIRNNSSLNDKNSLLLEYEDDISFETDALAYFKPYIDFLYLDIYNYVKNTKDYSSTLDFNIQRLLYTDKILKSNLIKSRVLRFHAIGFLLQREDDLKNKKFLKSFFEISNNQDVNNEINSLYKSLKD